MRKRCLWIVNHKTLLPIETALLDSFGFEVFSPKIIPSEAGFRSAVVDYKLDECLTLDRYVLDCLNRHHFYEEEWSATLTDILNDQFSLLISSFSGFTTPIFESIRKFKGQTIARVFGREVPYTYSEYFAQAPDGDLLLDRIESRKSKFWFGQAFDNLADVEGSALKSNAIHLPVGLPRHNFNFENTWTGTEPQAMILCPNILDSAYYGQVYEAIVRDFNDLPFKIFGRQNIQPQDNRVGPYVSDDELIAMYQRHRLFLYPSEEPRHLHYSPLEAVIIGQPVLYRSGGLMERLAKKKLTGECADTGEMKAKAMRLINGDEALAQKIIKEQRVILEVLTDDSVRLAWQNALERIGFNAFSASSVRQN